MISIQQFFYDTRTAQIVLKRRKSVPNLTALVDELANIDDPQAYVVLAYDDNEIETELLSKALSEKGHDTCLALSFLNIYPQAASFLATLSDIAIPSITKLLPSLDGFILPPDALKAFGKINTSRFESRFTDRQGLAMRWTALLAAHDIAVNYNWPSQPFRAEAIDDLALSFEVFYKLHHADLFSGLLWEPVREEVNFNLRHTTQFANKMIAKRSEPLFQSREMLQNAVKAKQAAGRIGHDATGIEIDMVHKVQNIDAPKYAFVATFPKRRRVFENVIKSALGQFDHIYVYLNGYETAPEYLEHPKITYRFGTGQSDFGARGKVEFAISDMPDGYWYFLDDDNELMTGYADYMARKVEQYGRTCAVCVHGSVLDQSGLWFFHKNAIYPYQRPQKYDRFVNLLGSGTLCLHSSMIEVKASDFHPYTMVDLSFSLLFKEQGIGIINVQRPPQLLKLIADADDGGLFHAYSRNLTIHTLASKQSPAMTWNEVTDLLDKKANQMDLKDLDPDQIKSWKESRAPKSWGVNGNVYVQTLGKMFDNFSGWIMPSKNLEETLSVLTHINRRKALRPMLKNFYVQFNSREALSKSFSVQGGEQIRRFLVEPSPRPIGQFFKILLSKITGTNPLH